MITLKFAAGQPNAKQSCENPLMGENVRGLQQGTVEDPVFSSILAGGLSGPGSRANSTYRRRNPMMSGSQGGSVTKNCRNYLGTFQRTLKLLLCCFLIHAHQLNFLSRFERCDDLENMNEDAQALRTTLAQMLTHLFAALLRGANLCPSTKLLPSSGLPV